MADGGWLGHALAAISEGFCPDDGSPLGDKGWCGQCRAWHSANFRLGTTTKVFPFPVAVDD